MTEIVAKPGDVLVFSWRGPEPDPAAVFAALGASGDPEKIDIFAASKIAPLGLDALLIEGHGVESAGVADAKTMLEALEGIVVVVPAYALEKETVLRPVSPATYVATFREEAAVRASAAPLPGDGAKGVLGATPVSSRKSDARVGGIVALAVLLFLFVFVVVFVVMAG